MPRTQHRTATKPVRIHLEEFARITENALDPGGLPSWLAAFVREALQETETLQENGAEQAVAARTALLKRLLGAAHAWLDTELDSHEAAQETGRCEETVRRAVRDGTIPDRRSKSRGRHKVRRGDLQKLAAPDARPYDPTADAQGIARLRRQQ
jgi:hypothetical protein